MSAADVSSDEATIRTFIHRVPMAERDRRAAYVALDRLAARAAGRENVTARLEKLLWTYDHGPEMGWSGEGEAGEWLRRNVRVALDDARDGGERGADYAPPPGLDG